MHKADKFKLNIYFDPMKRGSDITKLSAEIEIQRLKLEIESAINSLTDAGTKLTSEQARIIIEDICYKKERKE